VIALRATSESDFGLRAVQLNDGDIVDYIMLCAGVPVAVVKRSTKATLAVLF
jgi:hypothetical protein